MNRQVVWRDNDDQGVALAHALQNANEVETLLVIFKHSLDPESASLHGERWQDFLKSLYFTSLSLLTPEPEEGPCPRFSTSPSSSSTLDHDHSHTHDHQRRTLFVGLKRIIFEGSFNPYWIIPNSLCVIPTHGFETIELRLSVRCTSDLVQIVLLLPQLRRLKAEFLVGEHAEGPQMDDECDGGDHSFNNVAFQEQYWREWGCRTPRIVRMTAHMAHNLARGNIRLESLQTRAVQWGKDRLMFMLRLCSHLRTLQIHEEPALHLEPTCFWPDVHRMCRFLTTIHVPCPGLMLPKLWSDVSLVGRLFPRLESLGGLDLDHGVVNPEHPHPFYSGGEDMGRIITRITSSIAFPMLTTVHIVARSPQAAFYVHQLLCLAPNLLCLYAPETVLPSTCLFQASMEQHHSPPHDDSIHPWLIDRDSSPASSSADTCTPSVSTPSLASLSSTVESSSIHSYPSSSQRDPQRQPLSLQRRHHRKDHTAVCVPHWACTRLRSLEIGFTHASESPHDTKDRPSSRLSPPSLPCRRDVAKRLWRALALNAPHLRHLKLYLAQSALGSLEYLHMLALMPSLRVVHLYTDLSLVQAHRSLHADSYFAQSDGTHHQHHHHQNQKTGLIQPYHFSWLSPSVQAPPDTPPTTTTTSTMSTSSPTRSFSFQASEAVANDGNGEVGREAAATTTSTSGSIASLSSFLSSSRQDSATHKTPVVAKHSPFRCYGGHDPKARSFETIPSVAPTTRVDRPSYYSSRTKGLAFSIVQYAWKTVQRRWSTTSSVLASASAAAAAVRSDEQTRTRGRERCYDKSRDGFPIEHHEDDVDGERKQLSASVSERAPGEAGNNSIDDRDDREEGEGQEARGSAGKGVDGKPTMLLPHLETLKVYHTNSSSNSSTTSLQDCKKAYERYSKNEERKRANIVAYVGQLRPHLTFELMAGRFDDRPRKLEFHGDF